MRYATDLIASLGQATGTAEQDGTEQLVGVPHVLMPTIRIPGPVSDFNGFNTTEDQLGSFIMHREQGRAASQAAITVDIAQFSRGLWRVVISMITAANWTQGLDGTVANHLLSMVGPNGVAADLIAHFSINLVPQSTVKTWDWLFRQGGWQIQMRVPATGVGQTHISSVQVSASRLL